MSIGELYSRIGLLIIVGTIVGMVYISKWDMYIHYCWCCPGLETRHYYVLYYTIVVIWLQPWNATCKFIIIVVAPGSE